MFRLNLFSFQADGSYESKSRARGALSIHITNDSVLEEAEFQNFLSKATYLNNKFNYSSSHTVPHLNGLAYYIMQKVSFNNYPTPIGERIN